MVGLEGHPAARDMLGGEADRWKGVCELNRGRYQSLESWGRWGALRRGWWYVIRAGGVARRGGFIAAAVILTAATAKPPWHEGHLLVLMETHLQRRFKVRNIYCRNITFYTYVMRYFRGITEDKLEEDKFSKYPSSETMTTTLATK